MAAISNYTYPSDRDGRSYIEDKIRKGEYATYKPGDLATLIEEYGEARRVRVIDGESRGREGWVHHQLMEMTKESKEALAKSEEATRIAADKKRVATAKAAGERKRAAEEGQRKELAYVNSLPRLTGPGESVIVATSMDCARDLQSITDFGRKNGTGIDFRKKMLELVTLGCGTAMETGTPMVGATKNGPLVTFKAYRSGKEGVALSENVRWP